MRPPDPLLFLALTLLLSSCHVGRFFVWNFADIRDHRKFPARPLPASPEPFRFAVAAQEKAPKSIEEKGKDIPFDAWLKDHKTVAFPSLSAIPSSTSATSRATMPRRCTPRSAWPRAW